MLPCLLCLIGLGLSESVKSVEESEVTLAFEETAASLFDEVFVVDAGEEVPEAVFEFADAHAQGLIVDVKEGAVFPGVLAEQAAFGLEAGVERRVGSLRVAAVSSWICAQDLRARMRRGFRGR